MNRSDIHHCPATAQYCGISLIPAPPMQWRRKRYGRYGGRHTSKKFGVATPYQSAEIWAVDFQENR